MPGIGLLAVLLTAGLLMAGCESAKKESTSEKKEVHGMKWGYKGEIGPDRWGDLSPEFKLCKIGKAQSPIDIRETRKVRTRQLHRLRREEVRAPSVSLPHTQRTSV